MLLCLSPPSAFKTEINYPQPVKKQLTVAIIAFLVLVVSLVGFGEEREIFERDERISLIELGALATMRVMQISIQESKFMKKST